MTKVFRSPFQGQTYSSRLEYVTHLRVMLRNLWEEWDYSHWADWMDTYRMLKLLVEQHRSIEEKLHAQTTWEGIFEVINENLEVMYSHPLTFMDGSNPDHQRICAVENMGGMMDLNLQGTCEIVNVDRHYEGVGYELNVRLMLGPKGQRFRADDFRAAMGSYGIIVRNFDYMPAGEYRDKRLDSHYEAQMVFMKVDWPNLPDPMIPHEETKLDPYDPLDGDWSFLDKSDPDDFDERRKDEIIESYQKLIRE